MPSKSLKQRGFILALRSKYKSKKRTPKKWKWIWETDWLKVQERFIADWKRFNSGLNN